MPAVKGGGGKGAPAPKGRRKPAPAAYAPTKLRGASSVGLDQHVAMRWAGVVLLAAVGVTLATGGRAGALANLALNGVERQLGHAGFRVAHVQLQGVSPFAAADVLKAAAVPVGAPILATSLDDVRERVERVGWVRSARVIRLLPDTLVIAASERARLAVWQLNGRTYVIDGEGHVIPEADAGIFPDLPLVVGEGAADVAAPVLALVRQRPRLLERTEALVRVDSRRWDIRLKDGGLIQLPAANEDGALLQLDQLDQQSRLLELGFARIDLRDPEMITVRPRGSPTPAATARA